MLKNWTLLKKILMQMVCNGIYKKNKNVNVIKIQNKDISVC